MNSTPRDYYEGLESWAGLADAEKLIKEMYDEIYDEFWATGDEPDRHSQSSLALVVQLVMLVFYVICLVLVSVFYGGTIRYVFTLKALALSLSRSLEAGKNAFMIGDDELPPETTTFSLTRPEGREDLIKNWQSGVDGLNSLRNLTLTLDESISAIFLHELHQCTSKMQVRKRQAQRVVKKFLVVATTCLLLNVLQIPIFRAFPAEEMSSMYVSVRISLPVETALKCLITSASLYFGIRILISLKRSDEVRQEISSSGKKNCFLVGLVLTLMVAQVMKIMVYFTEMALSFFAAKNFHECIFDRKAINGIDSLTLPAIEKCISVFEESTAPLFVLTSAWCGVFEFFFIIAAGVRKKICGKVHQH